MHHTLHGTKEPFVFLIHGWCCNGDFWAAQIGFLAESHRVVVVELGEAADAPSIARFGQSVAALADDLQATSIVLIGHSMGGPVAIEAALSLGGRCRLIVGVDTFTDAAFYRRLEPAEKARRLDVFRRDFSGTMAAMVGNIISRRLEGLADRIAATMAATDPATALVTLDALLDWDIEEPWQRLACPIETINSDWLSAGIALVPLPGLTVHLMPDVGHFPMLEEPERFNALLGAILNRSQFS